MGFEKVQQWKRHQAIAQQNASSFKIVCFRCGVELPTSLTPGTVVLSKEDRLYIGDREGAQDCAV